MFSDDDVRQKLNGIVHPHVRERVSELCSRSENEDLVIIIPLLYESGFTGVEWDHTVCIYSSQSKQIERLLGRGLDEAGARARISSQLPNGVKATRSDFVIINNSSIESVERQLNRMLSEISGV